MSFIAKNPLTIPEIESMSSVPNSGTRGLFAGKDGWYDIDSDGEVKKIATKDEISGQTNVFATVDIKGGANNWVAENVEDNNGTVIGLRYGQRVNVNNATITPYSKVDLQITSEQMVVFYEKSLAFVAENDNGAVTVYCVGAIPENNYTLQAVITEVAIND